MLATRLTLLARALPRTGLPALLAVTPHALPFSSSAPQIKRTTVGALKNSPNKRSEAARVRDSESPRSTGGGTGGRDVASEGYLRLPAPGKL